METSRTKGKVRYALVGAGNIAQVAALPAFEHASENSELVAIVSRDATKRRELGERYGVQTADYDELEAVARRLGVDAVYLALPNSLHRSFTERAARAGLHVLCEKPMAMSSEDCRAMIDACHAAGTRLMIAYRLHFEEANLRAIDVVRSGQIGEARYFSSTFSQQVRPGDIRTRAEMGGGALFDMGIYCVNAARYLFGAEPTEVVATQVTGHDERSRGVDDTTSAILHFPGDRIAQLTASQGAADLDSYRIVGTKGDLRVEPAYGYTDVRTHHLTIAGAGQPTTKSFPRRDQFAPELVHFSASILYGTEPEPSGREGLADVRVLEAIARAAREGRRVVLEPFDMDRRPDLSQEMRKPPVGEQRTVRAPSPSR